MASPLLTLKDQLRLEYDPKRKMAFGNYRGYQVAILHAVNMKQYLVTWSVASVGGQPPEEIQRYLLQLPAQMPFIIRSSYENNQLSVSVKSKPKEDLQQLTFLLDGVTGYLATYGYQSCCSVCGSTQCDLGTYSINGSCRSICSVCFGKMQENIATAQADIKAKPGNYVTGIVGALLGSLIGVNAWVLVYQLGYIAAIVGLIMAVCTIKGYQLLGGKLNIAGVIICVVIMIGMLYLAENIAITIDLYNSLTASYGYTFFETFRMIPELMGLDAEFSGAVLQELLMGYIFMAVGSASMIYNAYKQANLRHEMVRLT